MKRSVWLLFLPFLFATCQDAASLRLATYTYADNNRISNLLPLSQEFEKTLDRDIKVVSYPDVKSLIHDIRTGKVDIAVINTLGYLQLSISEYPMYPVATLEIDEEASENYKTILLSRSDSIDLEYLKGHASSLTMNFVAEGSTSGNLISRLMLSSIGIKNPENDFKSVSYGGNHTSTFDNLLQGKADVCSIGSNEYFKQIRQDSSLLEQTSRIWTSNEIPSGPILLSNNLTEETRNGIIKTLLKLDRENMEALNSFKSGWSEFKYARKFQEIDDSFYDDFRSLNDRKTDLERILRLFEK